MIDVLSDKHPPGRHAHPDTIVDCNPPDVHPALFDSIDARAIRSAVLMLVVEESDICHVLALTARCICTNFVDPTIVTPIALNKNPGIHPIGIGDTIMAKAILAIVNPDIQDLAGSLQLSAGRIEAAVYAVDSLFQHEDIEAVLLVDAKNAFNSFNRLSALSHL